MGLKRIKKTRSTNHWVLVMADDTQYIVTNDVMTDAMVRPGPVVIINALTAVDKWQTVRRIGISLLHVLYAEQYTDAAEAAAIDKIDGVKRLAECGKAGSTDVNVDGKD